MWFNWKVHPKRYLTFGVAWLLQVFLVIALTFYAPGNASSSLHDLVVRATHMLQWKPVVYPSPDIGLQPTQLRKELLVILETAPG
jgi:hypothetical protein